MTTSAEGIYIQAQGCDTGQACWTLLSNNQLLFFKRIKKISSSYQTDLTAPELIQNSDGFAPIPQKKKQGFKDDRTGFQVLASILSYLAIDIVLFGHLQTFKTKSSPIKEDSAISFGFEKNCLRLAVLTVLL